MVSQLVWTPTPASHPQNFRFTCEEVDTEGGRARRKGSQVQGALGTRSSPCLRTQHLSLTKGLLGESDRQWGCSLTPTEPSSRALLGPLPVSSAAPSAIPGACW